MVNSQKKKSYDLYEPKGQQKKVLIGLLSGTMNGTSLLSNMGVKKSGGVAIQIGKLNKRGYIDTMFKHFIDSSGRDNRKPILLLNFSFFLGYIERNNPSIKFNKKELKLLKEIFLKNRERITYKSIRNNSIIIGIMVVFLEQLLNRKNIIRDKQYSNLFVKLRQISFKLWGNKELNVLSGNLCLLISKYYGGTDKLYKKYPLEIKDIEKPFMDDFAMKYKKNKLKKLKIFKKSL